MDSSTKKACLEEISFIVLDSEKKISVNTISNNWDVPMKQSQELLEEWVNSQKGKDFTKEHLVRGVDFNGNCYISLISDNKMDFIKSKMKKMVSSLYTIETSSSSKRLEIEELVEVKMMNLVIETEERDLEAPPEPEPVREVREVVKPVKPSMFAPIKKEEKSPKKVSPKKESPKETIKPVTSKGIASFFSAKPATANGNKKLVDTKKEKVSPDVKTEKKSPKEVEKKIEQPKVVEKKKTPEPKEDKKKPASSDKKSKASKKTENLTSLKRTLAEINGSDESDEDTIPGTPQEKKVVQNRKRSRPAKTETKNTKRIVAVESSSEDEMEVIALDDEVKEIKEEPTKDVQKNESKKAENGSKEKKRCIRKRMVQKTYEDDDGYFITTKVEEEYSCSDEEPVPEKKSINTNGKSTTVSKKPVVESPKSKPSPKPAKKQGNIMSFFTKK